MNILTSLRRHWVLSCTLLAVLALLALLAVGLTRDPTLLPCMTCGKPWPDRALPQMGSNAPDGEPVGPAQLRGKPRLVNVWASWCPVCSDEQPVLLELSKTLQAQGRSDQLIGLNYRDNKADAAAWLQRYGNPFATVLVDADGRMGIELGVYGAPESYLIDAQGTIVHKFVGALTPHDINKEVLPFLGAHP